MTEDAKLIERLRKRRVQYDLYTEVDRDALTAADRLEALIEENEKLRECLTAMVEAEVNYMTINHLGDPEKQHNVIWAREILK